MTMQFVIVKDAAKRAAIGDIYRQCFARSTRRCDGVYVGSIDKTTTDANAAQQAAWSTPPTYLADHMGDAPVARHRLRGRRRLDGVPAIDGGVDGRQRPAGHVELHAGGPARGLGTCWTTVHLMMEQAVADVVGIPFDAVQQVCLTPLAYTVGTDFKPADGPSPTRSSTGTPGDGRWPPSGGAGRHRLHAARRGRCAVRRGARRGRRPSRAADRSRSAPTAAAPRSGWATRPREPAPSCSPSTTIAARRRTRPGGSITTRRWSTPRTGQMDTLPFFRARSTTPVSRTSVLAIVGPSPTVARHWTTPVRRSCSSTVGTARNRPGSTTRAGRPTWPWAARWRSTTCSPTLPTAAARRTSRSTCRRWMSGRFASSLRDRFAAGAEAREQA